jgi:hypothetical protein
VAFWALFAVFWAHHRAGSAATHPTHDARRRKDANSRHQQPFAAVFPRKVFVEGWFRGPNARWFQTVSFDVVMLAAFETPVRGCTDKPLCKKHVSVAEFRLRKTRTTYAMNAAFFHLLDGGNKFKLFEPSVIWCGEDLIHRKHRVLSGP